MPETTSVNLTDLFQKYRNKIQNRELAQILDRKFVYSDVQSDADVLFCGINPSYRKDETNFDPYPFDFNNLQHDSYFSKLHKLLGENADKLKVTYIDLFYQRHTDQSAIDKFVEDDIGIQFLCDQLTLSQSIIEKLKPKLILVFNKRASDFWGLNSFEKNGELQNVWLGYEFEKLDINNSFRITGLLDSEARINQSLRSTVLTNTSIYFSKMLSWRTGKKEMEKIAGDVSELISRANLTVNT